MTDGERVLTASEVKVLTERACKVAYWLGHKDAGEEIAAALEDARPHIPVAEAPDRRDCVVQRSTLNRAARISRNLASQPAQASSDATSGVPGHPEVSEAVRSPQKPYEHVHSNGPDAADCTTCDGNTQ